MARGETGWATRIGVIVLALTLAATRAQATPVEERAARATELYEQGMAHYHLSEWDQAVQSFEQAFRLRPVAELLYNIAQSHRGARRLAQAVVFYKKYLLLAPTAPNRAEIEALISKLENEIASGTTSPLPSPSPPPSPAESPSPAPAESPSPPPPPSLSASPVSAVSSGGGRGGRTLQIAGFSTAGAGVVLVALGGAFASLGVRTAREVNDAPFGTVFEPDSERRVNTYNALAITGFVLGGAAIVAGVTVGVIGTRRGR